MIYCKGHETPDYNGEGEYFLDCKLCTEREEKCCEKCIYKRRGYDGIPDVDLPCIGSRCLCHSPKEEIQARCSCACHNPGIKGMSGFECTKDRNNNCCPPQESTESDSWEEEFGSRFACAYSPTDWTNDSHSLEEVKDWIRTKKTLWEEAARAELFLVNSPSEKVLKRARTLALQEAASAVRGMKWTDERGEYLHTERALHNSWLEDAAREIEGKI